MEINHGTIGGTTISPDMVKVMKTIPPGGALSAYKEISFLIEEWDWVSLVRMGLSNTPAWVKFQNDSLSIPRSYMNT